MKVTIQNKNLTFDCNAEENILHAALRQGIAMPYGCRGGKCGNCLGTIISGDITYPDGQPVVLTDAEIAANKALFCQAHANSDLLIDVKIVDTPQGIEIRKMPARVVSIDRLAEDVIHLKLKTPSAERLQFLAGQYIDFLLSDGRRRAFSLANPPHHDEFLEFHIRHVSGGSFTPIVFDELQEKALIRIEGPMGTFCLREGNQGPIIMMAGGTGMAPLRGMLLHLFATDNQRPVHLFWGARAQSDLYLRDEIKQWLGDFPQLKFTAVLSAPDKTDNWQGEIGWVHEAVTRAYDDLSAHEIYMSGPPPMINAARNAFLSHGLPQDKMFSDAFDFADDPGLSAEQKEAGNSRAE